MQDAVARAITNAKEIVAAEGIKTGPYQISSDLSTTVEIADPQKHLCCKNVLTKILYLSCMIRFPAISWYSSLTECLC